MIDCSKEIKQFHDERVTLQKSQQDEMRKRRNSNRERIAEKMDKNTPKIKEFKTQGSYAMHTMIQNKDNKYDIDDGIYFDNVELEGKSTQSVKQIIKDLVDDRSFNTSPKILKNCVRVYYEKGYHVDLPSYRIQEDGYELAGNDWEKSNPEAVTNWFNSQAKTKSPVGDTGQFKRIVRYLKKTADVKSNSISGLVISVLINGNYSPRSNRDDLCLYDTIQSIISFIDSNKNIQHPVLDEVLTETNCSKVQGFNDILKSILRKIKEIIEENTDKTAVLKVWKEIFCDDFFDEYFKKEDVADKLRKGIATTAIAGSYTVSGATSYGDKRLKTKSSGQWYGNQKKK